jgi:RHS repeat-associated protein
MKGEGDSYDFGARIYDPRLGKFFSADPDFNKYVFQNTYLFASDNPILLIDINGRGSGLPGLNWGTGELLWNDGQVNHLNREKNVKEDPNLPSLDGINFCCVPSQSYHSSGWGTTTAFADVPTLIKFAQQDLTIKGTPSSQLAEVTEVDVVTSVILSNGKIVGVSTKTTTTVSTLVLTRHYNAANVAYYSGAEDIAGQVKTEKNVVQKTSDLTPNQITTIQKEVDAGKDAKANAEAAGRMIDLNQANQDANQDENKDGGGGAPTPNSGTLGRKKPR